MCDFTVFKLAGSCYGCSPASAQPADLLSHLGCQHGRKWLTQPSELNSYPNQLDKPELKHIYTCWEPSFDTSVVYLNLLLSKGPQETVLWGCYISFCFWWIPLITHLDWNWVKFVSLLSILCFKHDTPILKVWTGFSHSFPLSAQLRKLLEISEGHAINVLVIEQGSINSYRRRQDVTRNKMTLKLIHLSAFATALQFIVPKLLYKY